nr:putative ribonuclease H-like domain-containing protein [Tanacetum cinerariifolium]
LDEALREKEDLKAKLKKFKTSSTNLTKLLDSQISAKVKIGLGYDSQFNEKEVLYVKVEEVTETVFDNRSSDKKNSLTNDRFKKGKGYHAVPPPLIGNYMPPKSDLSFARLDDSIYKFKISETVTSLTKDEKDGLETSIAFVEKTKEVRTTDESVKPIKSVKHVKPVKLVKTVEQIKKSKNFNSSPTVDREDWNGKMTQKLGVRIPISVAKPKAAASTSDAKPVNTARPKQSVNFSKSRSTFHNSQSPIRKSFYNATTHLRRNSTERVNTARSKALSVVKGNGVTAVKTSAGNKAYLADYQEINDGGFVAFGSSRGKITGKGLLRCFSWPLRMKLVRDLDEFYGMKGIKREYSNARTPQQNGVAERKNRTLIESSIYSTFKSSYDKAADDKPMDDTGSKTVEEPVNKEDQAYKDKLNR